MTYEELYELYYDDLTDEEKEELSFYIKDRVAKHKEKTTEFMDAIKYLVFVGLFYDRPKINLKIDSLYSEYNKEINKQVEKDLKSIKNKANELPKSKIKTDKVLDIEELKKRLKLDLTSTKTANDKYIKIVKNFYNNTQKTINADYVNKTTYLSEKVGKFDKAEKVVAYKNKQGNIVAYHDIADYDSMVHNTNMTNEVWNTVIDGNVTMGNDLVYVEPHMFSCPHCQAYQGRILSITGDTPEYPKLDEAISDGLKHPNCTHIIVPYENQDETNKYSGDIWLKKYNQRQKLQSLNLKKSRLRNDKKIFKELGDVESADKTQQKINRVNKKMREIRAE